MVEGKLKSHRFRRVQVKVPGGKTVQHYLNRTPKQVQCGGCGKPLHGIPRMTRTQAKNASKSLKRPERPYGGVLCSACMRQKIIEQNTK